MAIANLSDVMIFEIKQLFPEMFWITVFCDVPDRSVLLYHLSIYSVKT